VPASMLFGNRAMNVYNGEREKLILEPGYSEAP